MNKSEIEARILQLEKLWEQKLKTDEAGLNSKENYELVQLRCKLRRMNDD